MKTETGLTSILTLLRVCGAMLLVTSLPPTRAEGQQGNNAVYKNATTCCQKSVAFIDASVFGNSSTDICSVLNGILSGTSTTYPAGGAVIDARGLPAVNTSMKCTASPWGSGGLAHSLGIELALIPQRQRLPHSSRCSTSGHHCS
jgi:hypothetical protein